MKIRIVKIKQLLDKACKKKYLNPASLLTSLWLFKKSIAIKIKVAASTVMKNEIKSKLSNKKKQ